VTGREVAQSALEEAVRDLLRARLDLSPAECDCTFDGEPPPRCGQRFVAVWSDEAHLPGPANGVALDEYHGVVVTATVRFSLPFDRWREERARLRALSRRVIVELARDRWDNRVINAANALAGMRGGASAAAKPVGFTEGLYWAGSEPVRKVGPDWFHGSIDSGDHEVGAAQSHRFTGARRVQALLTAE
jgi:hypothetical protein